MNKTEATFTRAYPGTEDRQLVIEAGMEKVGDTFDPWIDIIVRVKIAREGDVVRYRRVRTQITGMEAYALLDELFTATHAAHGPHVDPRQGRLPFDDTEDDSNDPPR